MQANDFPPINYGGLHDLLGHLLRHASLRGQLAFKEAFGAHRITPLHYMIAELICANGPTTHRDVSAAMGTSASVITGVVRPMLQDGRLEILKNDADKRQIRYHLTSQGEVWFSGLREQIEMSETLLAGALNAQERETMIRLLRKMLDTPKRA